MTPEREPEKQIDLENGMVTRGEMEDWGCREDDFDERWENELAKADAYEDYERWDGME
jgi:hypothetical protein